MVKKTRLVLVSSVLAVVAALSVGAIVVAASPGTANNNTVYCSQEGGFGEGLCSNATRE
jgi:hypothetical protein